MDSDLLAAAREARDEARKRAMTLRLEAEEAADEYHRADEAVVTLERIKQGLDEFNKSASELLDK